MMSARSNRARAWAIVGGSVLLIGIVAVVVSAITGRTGHLIPRLHRQLAVLRPPPRPRPAASVSSSTPT